MKKSMFVISGITLVLTFVFFGLFVGQKQSVFLTLGVTSMTICYHFTVRMAIGTVCDFIMKNKVDYSRSWFSEKSFEKSLYKKLKVKCWKDFLPTFRGEYFSLKQHSIEEVLGAGCQAEIIHWLCIAASLLAMLFAIPFGSFGIFCATSVIGSLADLVYVIIQRYNRPRLIRARDRKSVV